MKLAEALALRADLQRKAEQLRSRIVSNARYQEGEEPAEDAAKLLALVHDVTVQLRDLVAAINQTNARIDLGNDGTMTRALATRDATRLEHAILIAAADAAAGGAYGRQMRSELRQISALPVVELRDRADRLARDLRELDGRIQQANWTNDLQEH